MLPVIFIWVILKFTGTELPEVSLTLFCVLAVPTMLVYWLMFSGDHSKSVKIPENIRMPVTGPIEKIDYSFANLDTGKQIYWSVFVNNVNAFLSPYEIVLVEITKHGLVSEQELMHAKLGTSMNKFIQKKYDFPIYTDVQIGIWKKFVNWCRDKCPSVNVAVLAVLESCFIFLVDFFARFPSLWNRYMDHWMIAYHLMEECEHGHHTTKELNDGFNHFTSWCGYLFTLCLVLFMSLILVPYHTIRYFPEHALTFRGFIQLVEYVVTVMIVNLYMTFGGLLFFIFRCKIADETIMEVFKMFEKNIYVPYCVDTKLFKHVTPKYIQEKFSPKYVDRMDGGRRFSTPAPSTTAHRRSDAFRWPVKREINPTKGLETDKTK